LGGGVLSETLKFGLKQGDKSQILFPALAITLLVLGLSQNSEEKANAWNHIPMKTGQKGKKGGTECGFCAAKIIGIGQRYVLSIEKISCNLIYKL